MNRRVVISTLTNDYEQVEPHRYCISLYVYVWFCTEDLLVLCYYKKKSVACMVLYVHIGQI